MSKFYVYQYVRLDGTPYYIGKGSRDRHSHRCHSVHVPSDKSRIVIISKDMTEADAFQAEVFLIFMYGRVDRGTGCLRNLTDGGEGVSGYKPTDEALAKLRAAMSKKRKPLPEEYKAKLSAAKIGKISPRKGKKHSAESIAKMRLAHKNEVENRKQKKIDKKMDELYLRIAMNRARNHEFTPAGQPTTQVTIM